MVERQSNQRESIQLLIQRVSDKKRQQNSQSPELSRSGPQQPAGVIEKPPSLQRKNPQNYSNSGSGTPDQKFIRNSKETSNNHGSNDQQQKIQPRRQDSYNRDNQQQAHTAGREAGANSHAPIYVDDEIMDLSSDDESEDAEERLDHVHDILKRNGNERISMLVERSNASNNLANAQPAPTYQGGSPAPESPRNMYNGAQQPAERITGHLSNSSDGPVIAEYSDANPNIHTDQDATDFDEIPRQATERRFSEEEGGALESDNSEDATRQLIETERRYTKPAKLHQTGSTASVDLEDTSDGMVSKGKGSYPRDNRKTNSQDLDEVANSRGVGVLRSNNSTELIKKQQRKIKINVTTSNASMQAYNGGSNNLEKSGNQSKPPQPTEPLKGQRSESGANSSMAIRSAANNSKTRVSTSQTRAAGVESSLSQQNTTGAVDLSETSSPQKQRQPTRERQNPQNQGSLSKKRQAQQTGVKPATTNAPNQAQPEDPLRRKTLHNFNTRSSKTLGQQGVHHATSATAMQNSNHLLRQQQQPAVQINKPRRQLANLNNLPPSKEEKSASVGKQPNYDGSGGRGNGDGSEENSPYQRGSTYVMPSGGVSHHYNGGMQQPQYLTQYGQKFSKSQSRKTSHNLNASAGEGALAMIQQQQSAGGPNQVVSGGGTITLKNQSLSRQFIGQQVHRQVEFQNQPSSYANNPSDWSNNVGYQKPNMAGAQNSNVMFNKNQARLALTQNNFYNSKGGGFSGSQNLMRINETVASSGADSDSGTHLPNNQPPGSRQQRKSRKAQEKESGSRVINNLQGGGPSPYENVPGSGPGAGIFQSKTGRNTFYVSDNNRQKHSLLKELSHNSKNQPTGAGLNRQQNHNQFVERSGHSANRQGQRVIWGGPGTGLQSQQATNPNNMAGGFTKPRALSRQADAQIRIEVHRDTKIRNYLQAEKQENMTLMFYDFNGSSKQGLNSAANTAQNFYKPPMGEAADEYVAQPPMGGFANGPGGAATNLLNHRVDGDRVPTRERGNQSAHQNFRRRGGTANNNNSGARGGNGIEQFKQLNGGRGGGPEQPPKYGQLDLMPMAPPNDDF